MREFAKVGTGFWSSTVIQSLSDEGKLLALYLATGPHSNAAGVYRLPDGYVMADLGWSLERVTKGFLELSLKGYATRCVSTFWVVVAKHFKHNPIENPNQAKHVLKLLEQVPSTSEIVPLLINVIKASSHHFPEGWTERFMEPFGKGSKRVPKQREGEGEGKREGDEGSAAPPPCPQQKLVDLYHELLPTHRKVQVLNDQRTGTLRARWREMWDERKRRGEATTADALLAAFRVFFSDVAASKFLTGKTAPQPGKPPFIADLDWLMGPQNFVKVFEGKYGSGTKAKAGVPAGMEDYE